MNSFTIQTDEEARNESKTRSDSFKNKKSSKLKKFNDPNGKLVNVNEDNIYAVFISCVEIYNNCIYDLLDDMKEKTSHISSMTKQTHQSLDQQPGTSLGFDCNNISLTNNKMISKNVVESKKLKEDNKGDIYIKDLNEIEVKSTEEALELVLKSRKNRVISSFDETDSFRSHCIFTIRVVQSSYDPSKNDDVNVHLKNKSNIHVSQLSFVDLAETTKRNKINDSKLKEAGSINSSLMALRNCMEALRENLINGTKKMVPYRDSKLTTLFKSYFEGNGKIKMILCVNPCSIEFDEIIVCFLIFYKYLCFNCIIKLIKFLLIIIFKRMF
jgi:kinesin family protein 23